MVGPYLGSSGTSEKQSGSGSGSGSSQTASGSVGSASSGNQHNRPEGGLAQSAGGTGDPWLGMSNQHLQWGADQSAQQPAGRAGFPPAQFMAGLVSPNFDSLASPTAGPSGYMTSINHSNRSSPWVDPNLRPVPQMDMTDVSSGIWTQGNPDVTSSLALGSESRSSGSWTSSNMLDLVARSPSSTSPLSNRRPTIGASPRQSTGLGAEFQAPSYKRHRTTQYAKNSYQPDDPAQLAPSRGRGDGVEERCASEEPVIEGTSAQENDPLAGLGRKDRRRAQNRVAQRAFRVRSKAHHQDVAAHVEHLESLSATQFDRIERLSILVRQLQHENTNLRHAQAMMEDQRAGKDPEGARQTQSSAVDHQTATDPAMSILNNPVPEIQMGGQPPAHPINPNFARPQSSPWAYGLPPGLNHYHLSQCPQAWRSRTHLPLTDWASVSPVPRRRMAKCHSAGPEERAGM